MTVDPSRNELFEKVDRLLHDAEHAEGGAWTAKATGDAENAGSLIEKANRLRAEAIAIDPEKSAPAWQDDEAEEAVNAKADEAFAAFLQGRRAHRETT